MKSWNEQAVRHSVLAQSVLWWICRKVLTDQQLDSYVPFLKRTIRDYYREHG